GWGGSGRGSLRLLLLEVESHAWGFNPCLSDWRLSRLPAIAAAMTSNRAEERRHKRKNASSTLRIVCLGQWGEGRGRDEARRNGYVVQLCNLHGGLFMWCDCDRGTRRRRRTCPCRSERYGRTMCIYCVVSTVRYVFLGVNMFV
ncbi:unnamed protein product, partial [Ectocarpus sp. 12 AP-2014]